MSPEIPQQLVYFIVYNFNKQMCRIFRTRVTGVPARWNFAPAWGIVEIQAISRSPDGQ
jgi:hypothetical protein